MKYFVFILLSILFGLSVFAEEKDTPNWQRVAPNNYVDYETIVGLEDIYGYSFLLKSFNKGQYEPVNGKQILYTLAQYEINCPKHSYKIGIIDSYDEEGFFVSGDYNKYAQFQPIVEGTAIDVIANKLCRP